jgi:hypothetical protein
MRTLLLPLLGLCVPWLPAPPVHALQGVSTAMLGQSHGLSVLDGRIVGAGPGWTASLSSAGVRVAPLLGSSVEATAELHLGLESVQRGAWSRSYSGQELEPTLEGSRALYARPGLLEWYESRVGGLEQHFTFPVEPAGAGDLLVELTAKSALPWEAPGTWATEQRLVREGQAVLQVRGVLGIDAAGRTQAGDLLAQEGRLWLRLPGEFVDNASYPLVLDPLIGAVGNISTAGDAASVDVAFHAGLNQYLAVWSVDVSLIQAEVRAQVLDQQGATVGGLITVAAGSGQILRDPVVGTFRDAGSFLVAYRNATFYLGPFGVQARSVLPVGTVSGPTTILATSSEVGPELALGSEALTGQGDGNLLFYSAGGTTASGLLLVPGGFGVPTVSGAPIVPPGQSVFGSDQVSLPRTGGAAGLYLLTWRSRGLIGDEVRAVVVRRNGTLMTPSVSATVPNLSVLAPAVDGYPISSTNARWLLAAQSTETPGASKYDVRAWAYHFNGTTLSISAGPITVDATLNSDEREPAVLWMGSKAFVSWAVEGGSLDYDILVKGVEPLTCVECEPVSAVSTGSGLNRLPAMAGELPSNGGDGNDRAVILWERIPAVLPFNADIQSRSLVLSSQTGSAVSQGGGCGGGGSSGVNQSPAIGVGAFACTLTGADPAAPAAILNIAVNGAALPIPCGTCVLEPYFITVTVPVVSGSSAVNLAIPCRTTAIGAQLIAQWTVLLSAASPCAIAANVSLSDRLLVTIGS